MIARRVLGLLLAVVPAVAATTSTSSPTPALAPHRSVPLPSTFGELANDVAWQDESTLLIASNRLIYRFDLRTQQTQKVISDDPVPEGLPTPVALASDGKTVMAISPWAPGSFTLRLNDNKRLLAQRSPVLVANDAAVAGTRACVLARSPFGKQERELAGAVWCGKPDDAWTDMAPAHSIRSSAGARNAFRIAPAHSGAITMEPDGTLDVITSVEPGVYRYSPDGRLVEILGQSLDELVLNGLDEMVGRFAGDVQKRYQLFLNTQPTIDDLVATPEGPAIVVRIADKKNVRWELWYPSRDGGVRKRVPLNIARPGPFGHLRCAARGAALACIGSAPPPADAAVVGRSEKHPKLWLLTLKSK